MNVPVLELNNVTIAVNGKIVCSDISFSIDEGDCHVLLGSNGSGKSSLLRAIMGIPEYKILHGEIRYRGEFLNPLNVYQRAKLGIGMAFQYPPKLSGVTVGMFVKAIGATELFEKNAALLKYQDFVDRDINDGFSGGEIKRWEILRLFLQQPALCLMDEPESGVDFEYIASIGEFVNKLMNIPNADGSKKSGLLITHTGFILDYVDVKTAYMMVDGRIISTSDPHLMMQHIKDNGFLPFSANNSRSL